MQNQIKYCWKISPKIITTINQIYFQKTFGEKEISAYQEVEWATARRERDVRVERRRGDGERRRGRDRRRERGR